MRELNYCDKCNHTGYIRIDNNSVRYCECYKRVNTLKRLYNEGLGYLLEKCTFDSYEHIEDYQKHIYDKAREFTTKDNGWFTILGQSGIGKTHICIAILNELLNKGKECYYIRWNNFVLELNKKDDSEQYLAYFDRIKNYEVLYIDDFLKPLNDSKPSEADLKKAYELIDYRVINQLQTIISSERCIDELEQLDCAIASRIADLSRGYLLKPKTEENRNYRKREL